VATSVMAPPIIANSVPHSVVYVVVMAHIVLSVVRMDSEIPLEIVHSVPPIVVHVTPQTHASHVQVDTWKL
jgi:hypothetical protein